MRRSRMGLTVVSILAMVVGLAAPAAAAGQNYVALGDSYSSGVGAGNYLAASGSCDRSPNAYPALWAARNAPSSFVSVACAGATTADVEAKQLSALSSSTTLVSITVGGNDENFASIMQDCNLSSDSTCVNEIQTAETNARATLPGRLAVLFGDIASRAPGAHVVLLGYPRFYDLARSCIGLSATKRTKVDEGIDVLDGVLSQAASSAAITFGDVRGAFGGRVICDSNRWLHSLNFFDLGESYHPTASGHSGAYLPVFGAAA